MGIMDDIFGQDIMLAGDGQALVAADGSLVLTAGVETGLQDIRMRLFSRLGELFYDRNFGALVHNWINEENTLANRLTFEAEVARRVDNDPRVVVGSAACTVSDWDETGITARLTFEFIDVDHPYNLVIAVSSDKMDMVVDDADPI